MSAPLAELYPAELTAVLEAEVAEHLATGGEVGALFPTIRDAQRTIGRSRGMTRGIRVVVSDCEVPGLLYVVDVAEHGHKIVGAVVDPR